MNRSSDYGLDKKLKLFGKFNCRVGDLVFFLGITFLAIAIRYTLRGVVSTDFTTHLGPWYNEIESLGGKEALSRKIGNYSPLYMYLFTLSTYLGLPSLYAVKLITLVFDAVTAIVFFFLAYKWTESFKLSSIVYGLVLLLPSVLMNGAMWGQCDIIYTLFLVLSMERLMSVRPIQSCIFFGIAFSFKLQAIFFLPILIVFIIKRKLKVWHLLFMPLVYLVSTLPAVLAGRNIVDILSIYVIQTKTYTGRLTLNFPNIYHWTGDLHLEWLSKASIVFTAAVLLFFIYYIYTKKFEITPKFMFTLSVFFLMLIPFTLPFMHERYAFPADIFAILLLLMDKKYIWLVISTQLLSLFAYQACLFKLVVIPYSIVAFFYLCVLIILGIDLSKQMTENRIEKRRNMEKVCAEKH